MREHVTRFCARYFIIFYYDKVTKQLNQFFFEFLWGRKRNNLSRSVTCIKLSDGGLGMIDLKLFFDALKAAWVPRFLNITGKWLDYVNFHCQTSNLTLNYFLRMNFKNENEFPLIKKFPPFYRAVLLAYNRSKSIIPFDRLSKYDFLNQPLWGNIYFKCEENCLFFKEFVSSGILYIRDLINADGTQKNSDQISEILVSRRDITRQLYLVRKYVFKKFKTRDLSGSQQTKLAVKHNTIYKKKSD